MSVHRMEIITGTGRRRSWPTAIREQIVSETLAAETTVTEVARRHDVDRSLVYRWRREFGVVGRVRETGMFLPVEVSDGGAATGTPSDATAEMAVDPGLIEIVLGGGRSVRGGLGSLPGAVVGAALLVIIPEYLRDLAEYKMLVYGLLLIVSMALLPRGLVGLLEPRK